MIPKNENKIERYDPDEYKFSISPYSEDDPTRYMNYFFNTITITKDLNDLFTALYPKYLDYNPDQILDILIEGFPYDKRKEFSVNLRSYVFDLVEREINLHDKKSVKKTKMSYMRKHYIPKLVEFIKLFLRGHLIRQEEFNTQEEYEQEISNNYGYSYLDIACHKFAIGKTFSFIGWLIYLEQDPFDRFGILNPFIGIKDIRDRLFYFEVDKENYRKFRERFGRVMGDRIFFEFMVTNVIGPNHAQGKVLSSS